MDVNFFHFKISIFLAEEVHSLERMSSWKEKKKLVFGDGD